MQRDQDDVALQRPARSASASASLRPEADHPIPSHHSIHQCIFLFFISTYQSSLIHRIKICFNIMMLPFTWSSPNSSCFLVAYLRSSSTRKSLPDDANPLCSTRALTSTKHHKLFARHS